jgi:hypothetical protein
MTLFEKALKLSNADFKQIIGVRREVFCGNDSGSA